MLWLNKVILGNTVLRWCLALGCAAGGAALVHLLQGRLGGRLAARAARTLALLDVCLANLLARTHPLFLLALAITLGVQFLDLPARLARHLDLLAPLALILQMGAWAHWAVGLWIERRWLAPPLDSARGASASRAAVFCFILRLALWSLGLLLTLDLLGFNITTLLASLGIGGIAVALAVQNILGDLFASLSITLDQPFVLGDFIIVDDYLGTVEFIGLKTTRIRSLSGEQVIIANGDLLKSRIRNFKRMVERRVLFLFAIAYRTPAEQIALIPGELQRIISAVPRTRFDRAHFKEFSDAGLRFEVVYYVLDADYNLYMDIQQAINLGILQTFRSLAIEFAFPARTLLRQPSPPPAVPPQD
jgi:small-conductance mechanosensitive channel